MRSIESSWRGFRRRYWFWGSTKVPAREALLFGGRRRSLMEGSALWGTTLQDKRLIISDILTQTWAKTDRFI